MSMQINENLLKSFVKAMNVEKEKETRLLYGTITKVVKNGDEKTAYVNLDGADPSIDTPVVEGTAVMEGDRVAVTIENHKAVVVSNITSPASGRTDTAYMDLVDNEEVPEESGLKIGLLERSDYYVLVTPSGMYLKYGDNTLAKYTAEGTTLYGENGTKTAEFSDEGTILYDTSEEPTAEFTSTGITLNLGYSGGLSHTAFLKGGALELYQNWQGYDHHDGMTRIQPGYFEMENNAGDRVSMSSGSVNAEYGCNTKVAYVPISSATNISVIHNSSTSGQIQAVIPIGYKPVSIIKAESVKHPCYFVNLEVNENGLIKYTLHNPGGSDWTDVGVKFTVSCVMTG